MSSCKVRANPVLVVDLEFEELRLCVYIARGAMETSPEIELGLLASQVDALPIELAGPGTQAWLSTINYKAPHFMKRNFYR